MTPKLKLSKTIAYQIKAYNPGNTKLTNNTILDLLGVIRSNKRSSNGIGQVCFYLLS